jgi:hypothetical protein
MALYAQSSWVECTVPTDNGGCGNTHRRPYVNGVAVHPYALNCPPCEDFLRAYNSDQWSVNVADIPETHDEKKAREQADKAGKMDRERQLAVALEQLAPLGALPEVLTRFLAQVNGLPLAAALPGLLECANGHASPAGQKFCGQCGSPLSTPAPAAAISGPQPPPTPRAAPHADVKPPRMRDGRGEVLRAFAKANSLDGTGTRAELVARLGNAGLTGKWSAFAASWQPDRAAA